MESIIKWQTGVPKKTGTYVITLSNGCIAYDDWYKTRQEWDIYTNNAVIAWCPMSEIEPYKE